MLSIFKLDVAEALQLGFQESASPVMEEIINFHNEVMIYLTFILIGVLWIMIESIREYSKTKKVIGHKYLIHGIALEIIWTITPAFIFLLFPFYSVLLNLWLGDEFNQNILDLTKIFSLCGIFASTSHILVTKFEASQTLRRNLKFEFILMPFFLIILYTLVYINYSLIYIASIILIKESILLFLRLNFLKKEIKNVFHYYLYSIFFIMMLYMSFKNEFFFYFLEIALLISLIKNDKWYYKKIK